MRVRTLLAALVLAASSFAIVPAPAFADGIERPHRPAPVRRAPPRRPAPAPIAAPPAPAPIIDNSVTLPAGFFGASAGGVGIDVGTGYVGGSSRVIVQGGSASAVSISYASASASARAGGFGVGGGRGGHGGGGRGGHGGGGGCGCGH